MKLMSMISKFARSPQGRRYAQQAVDYAKSPEGKRRIDGVRKQLATRGRKPPRLSAQNDQTTGIRNTATTKNSARNGSPNRQ